MQQAIADKHGHVWLYLTAEGCLTAQLSPAEARELAGQLLAAAEAAAVHHGDGMVG